MAHYGWSKISLAFDAQYDIVMPTLLITFVALALILLASTHTCFFSSLRLLLHCY